MCLICNETVAIVKSGNVKRHYDSKHGHFDHNYPLKSEHKKPFSDSEIVKECMNEITIALFEGTQKDDIIQKINQISLSDSTAVKRTEVLAEDLLDQMKSAIKKAKCISLALDESTDNTDNAQLLVFVRFFDEEKGEFCEDVLGLTALHGHTRGDDIYEALIQMLRDREIDLKHVISIATDGAPCMTGRERVLVARLRAHHPDLIAYHCIIHQMVLCASLEEKYAEVMTTVMKLLNQTAGTHHHHNHAEFLDKLIKNFQTRFGDFPLGKQVLLCMENPFLVKNIAEFSTEALKICPWASAASLQSELIELQENLALQESLCDPTTFWTKMVPAAGVPSLQKVALQILTMFPSTYCCESAFSTMNMVKNKYRSTLSNEHLHQCLRLALTPFMPKFKELVAQKRCHFSH
ncbi:GT2D2 protein, partial [Amia calva]|nr:GT2D2 protein [Amia calva]